MPASYPGAIKSFAAQTDNVDNVDATDINQAYDEIEAIETELGTDPAGSFATVKLLLAQTVAEKATAAGQLFYATAANAISALSIGAANRILRVNAAGTAPEWAVQNPRTLNVVTAETEVVNTVTETAVYTFSVPANTFGTDTMLRLQIHGSYFNNSGASRNITFRLKYGATTIITLAENTIAVSTNRQHSRLDAVLKGNGATNAQRAILNAIRREFLSPFSAVGGAGALEGTSAIDSTVAQNLVVTVEHSAASASLSYIMRFATLEVMPVL